MKGLLILLIVLPSFLKAQDSLTYELIAAPRPVTLIKQPVFKLAPLSLLDLDPTVQAAVEIPLKQRWSVQQEIGVGWPRLGLANYQKDLTTTNKQTLRLRTEIRYYFSPDIGRKGLGKTSTNGFYVAGEVLAKRMTLKSSREVSGVSTWPNLPPRELARIQRHVYGLHAKVGYQGVLSRKHPQFVVDVYVGAGFRLVSVRQVSSPSGTNVNGVVKDFRYSRFDPFDGWRNKPSLAGGVKIGWMINTGKKARKK